jgi:hypothetical protein
LEVRRKKEMTITIAPFTVDSRCTYTAPLFGDAGKEGHTQRDPLTYWGIYIDDKYVSYTSSKELAEKTKVWMEKWLKDRL